MSKADDLKQAAVAKIQRKYGKNALFIPGQMIQPTREIISTKCLPLDIALGIGGIERGRIIDIFGPESVGKSALALQLVASEQEAGRDVIYIDSEHALSEDYAKQNGVDINKLIINQPDNAEEALDIIDTFAKTGTIGMIVVDSTAALLPKIEQEAEAGSGKVAAIAQLMSPFLRRITGVCNKTLTTLVFISQLREKVGVVFGNPTVVTGGKAIKFYAYYRFDVQSAGYIKDKDTLEIIGHRLKIKVAKNKSAPPFKVAEVDLIYGKGIDNVGATIDLAAGLGIIKKNGAWYSYEDNTWQGRDNVIKEINPFFDEITKKVRNFFGL